MSKLRTSRPAYLAVLALLASATTAPGPAASEEGLPRAARLVTQLLASDGDPDDQFGGAVAISGDSLVVGASGDDGAGSDAGAAYVFTLIGGSWVEQQKLTASDAANFDAFGNAVAIDGDTVVVGAYAADAVGNNSGAVYVFTRASGVWSQQQKLVGEAGVAWFGWSVDVSGDTLVVGSPLDNQVGTNSGAAHVFTRSGTVWSQQQKLVAGDGTDFDRLGESVSVDVDTVVAGAFNDSVAGPGSGSAYVFTRSVGVWTEQQKLTPSDGMDFGYFGIGVSVDGDTALVGADEEFASGPGAAYVFTRSVGVWTEEQKLTASDGTSGSRFGHAVAVSGDTALVGAFDPFGGAGAAYLYQRSGVSWSETEKLADPNGQAGDYFGIGVGVSGSDLLVGASRDDDNGDFAGSAFTYQTGPGLEITGECPSSVTIQIDGATPGGSVAIVWSVFQGSTIVPSGTCAGTMIDLDSPKLLARVTADAQGDFSATISVPLQACGLFLQALDVGSCGVTGVAQIP